MLAAVGLLQDSVAGYEVEILDITATGEVLSGDAKEEAEVEAHIEADIADQLEVLRQVGLCACYQRLQKPFRTLCTLIGKRGDLTAGNALQCWSSL